MAYHRNTTRDVESRLKILSDALALQRPLTMSVWQPGRQTFYIVEALISDGGAVRSLSPTLCGPSEALLWIHGALATLSEQHRKKSGE